LSLVIALASRKEALLAGDRRSITFLRSCQQLEEELYSGKILDEEALLARAKALRATMQISDGRQKVWRRGDLLAGEVTEISPSRERRRRVYVAPGAYLLVEVAEGRAEITRKGSSGLVILGNCFAQSLSKKLVEEAKGRIDEQLLRAIFEEAGRSTPSVSREFDLLSIEAKAQNTQSLQSPQPLNDPQSPLAAALEDDARNSGWELCARQ
jgi:hypothetical protein